MSLGSASIHPIVRGRWIILAVVAALCAWLVPGLRALEHDDDVLAFLPADHPDVVAFGEVAEKFGMLEVALVGLRNPNGEGLLEPEATERVRALGIAVSELPGVRLVLSYPELPDAKVEGETLVVEPLVPKGLSDAERLRSRVLGNKNAVGNLISADGSAAMLLVYLLPTRDLADRGENLHRIRELVQREWGAEAHFGGGPFAEQAAALASRSDIERLSPVVIGVLVTISAVLLWSVSGALLNLVITGLGVVLVVGAHGRFAEPLTIVSGTIPVMMVALGGAFGMHMIAGYQRQSGTPAARASATLRELFAPVSLSGITTATAFFALIVMPQVPMQRFGIAAGLGVLVLLLLALVLLPALLSLLPPGALPTRAERKLPFRVLPPLWALAGVALLGSIFATQLDADPDTRNVFDEQSEPARADAFLAEHFGGSQFVQVAIEADLSEPAVLRAIRGITERLADAPGVHDVRSLLDPVALLTKGFGGRAGVPETPARTRRVITNLADQAAMAQLMTADKTAAIVHVKLAPASSAQLQQATARVRAIVAEAETELRDGALQVGSASSPAVSAAQRATVRARVERLANAEISDAALDALVAVDARDPAVSKRLAEARTRAFGTDEVVEPLSADEYERVPLSDLAKLRGEDLEAKLREHLPTLVENDPKGIGFAAEQLGQWVDEILEQRRIEAACASLKLSPPEPGASPRSEGCAELLAVLSELEDTEWTVPSGVDAPVDRRLPIRFTVTGQPVIGRAFADSVTRSLFVSTLVSVAALTLTLLFAGHILALLPALWTLAVTAGTLAVLGHPISIGTSMVSCIALGAGVDFSIHLAVRARELGGRNAGQRAVDVLGIVILSTGVQLAVAFSVLLGSRMPPLRQFGAGLALGLLFAALGAVWFAPRIYRGLKNARASKPEA